MAEKNVLVEQRGAVALLTLNRPQALNALNSAMLHELADRLGELDRDASIGAIVLTGSEKAFAAGADIKEMQDLSFPAVYVEEVFAVVDRIAATRKPLIAAVAGFALGGGCELAMACDIVIAAQSARFGQPEITLGVMPGFGGTQRLVRAIGKAKAMDLYLTGRTMDAAEAERSGLVARVVPLGELLEEALKIAERIASFSRPSVLMLKESVGRAFELGLSEGIRFERRLFQSLFATKDQKEGMAAFIEKRPAKFKDR